MNEKLLNEDELAGLRKVISSGVNFGRSPNLVALFDHIDALEERIHDLNNELCTRDARIADLEQKAAVNGWKELEAMTVVVDEQEDRIELLEESLEQMRKIVRLAKDTCLYGGYNEQAKRELSSTYRLLADALAAYVKEQR